MSPTAHPKTFCGLAADLGYPSRPFNPQTGGCATDFIDVTATPGRNGLRNNLAYYSMGEYDNPTKLMSVSLILNVNNTQEAAKAHAELARVASSIANRILGSAPKGLQDAILQSASRSWSSGVWTTEVKCSVWPTGLGHDVTVYFRPASAR